LTGVTAAKSNLWCEDVEGIGDEPALEVDISFTASTVNSSKQLQAFPQLCIKLTDSFLLVHQSIATYNNTQC
jgi:hypothetical protein